MVNVQRTKQERRKAFEYIKKKVHRQLTDWDGVI